MTQKPTYTTGPCTVRDGRNAFIYYIRKPSGEPDASYPIRFVIEGYNDYEVATVDGLYVGPETPHDFDIVSQNKPEDLNCLHAEKLANLEIWNGKLSDANYKLMVENEGLRDAADDVKYWKTIAIDLAKLIQKDGRSKPGTVSSEMYYRAEIVLANSDSCHMGESPDSEVAEKGIKVADDSKNSVKMSLNDGSGKVMKFTVGKSYPMRNGEMAEFIGISKIRESYPLIFVQHGDAGVASHMRDGQYDGMQKCRFDIMQGDEPETESDYFESVDWSEFGRSSNIVYGAATKEFEFSTVEDPESWGIANPAPVTTGIRIQFDFPKTEEDTAIERGLDKMVERGVNLPKAGEWWEVEFYEGRVFCKVSDIKAYQAGAITVELGITTCEAFPGWFIRRLAPHEIPVIAASQEGDRKRYCLGDMWVVWEKTGTETWFNLKKSVPFSSHELARDYARTLLKLNDLTATIAITRADATDFYEGEGL